MKYIRFIIIAISLFIMPSSAWAVACVTTAYAHPTGGSSPWAWSGATTWATLSGGAVACTLAAGNAVVFDSGSTAGSYNIDTTGVSILTLATSGATAGITVTANNSTTTLVTGTAFDMSGVTFTASASTQAFSFTDPNNTGDVVLITPGSGNTFGNMTLGLSTTTTTQFRLVGNLTGRSDSTITHVGGVFDLATNNVNWSYGILISNNANTRTLNCGTGTFTFTNNGGLGTQIYSYNSGTATINCSSATFTFQSTTANNVREIDLNTNNIGTINVVWVSGDTAPTPFFLQSVGNPTIGTLNLNPGASGAVLILSSTPTYTVSNQITWAGTQTAPLNIMSAPQTSTASKLATIAAGANAPSLTWTMLSGIKFTGTTGTATNSWNGGNVSGINVSLPIGGGSHCIGC